jgi:hypothetical protein
MEEEARELRYRNNFMFSNTHPYLLPAENLLAAFSFSFHFFPLFESLRKGVL